MPRRVNPLYSDPTFYVVWERSDSSLRYLGLNGRTVSHPFRAVILTTQLAAQALADEANTWPISIEQNRKWEARIFPFSTSVRKTGS